SPVKPSVALDNAAKNLGTALESILTRLLTEHERLLAFTHAHRAAIARADTAGIEAAMADQRSASEAIARLETQRQQLMGAVSKPGATSIPPTLSAIAQTLPDPAGTRLLGLAARLRETIGKV